MGSPDTPTPPDQAKAYEQGIQVYLKYLPQLLAAENSSKDTYDPINIQRQQDEQAQYGPTQYAQQLDAFKQLDPTYYANREALGATVGNELASGSSLTPAEEQQVESYTRAAQAARGNMLGNAPATAEAYALGDRGRQILQQRVSNASAFLAAPTIPQQLTSIAPVSADRSFSYVDPNAGFQGQNFALQNYQNILGASQVAGGNPWGSALSGAASGAAAGTAISPGYGTAIGAVAGGIGGYFTGQSDRRLKRDIVRVAEVNGIPVYEFRYVGQPTEERWRGVMSDDIEEDYPEAVMIGPGGFRLVDYSALGLTMGRV